MMQRMSFGLGLAMAAMLALRGDDGPGYLQPRATPPAKAKPSKRPYKGSKAAKRASRKRH